MIQKQSLILLHAIVTSDMSLEKKYTIKTLQLMKLILSQRHRTYLLSSNVSRLKSSYIRLIRVPCMLVLAGGDRRLNIP